MAVHDTCDGRNQELTVLVADDNEINQKVVQRILQTAGYRMDMVDNGRQAVEFACQIQYDLILMDIQMPLMDGYEATKRIRNWECGLRPIGACAYAPAGMRNTNEMNSDFKSEIRNLKSQISNPKSQISLSRSEIPNPKSPFPIPHSPFPIPHSPFKKVPIVAMTGNAVEAEIENCRKLGINDCIGKPLSPDRLLAMMKKWTAAEPVCPPAGPAPKDVSRPPAKTTCAHQPVDLERALREFMGEKEVLAGLLQLFTEKVRTQISAIQHAILSRDYQVVAKEAHSIKGAAGNLTADNMAGVAADLEEAADLRQAEPVRQLVGRLAEKLQQLEAYLQDEMSLLTE